MQKIMVFKAEREAGIGHAIQANSRVTVASVARQAESEKPIAPDFTRGAAGFDLHHITSVLATVGWNKNDDVFERGEMWSARATPEDKQLNYEHDDGKIVGHITSNWLMDDAGNVLTEGSAIDDLPAKFHVVTGAVLYKCWQTPELQTRMDTLLAEIAKGEWFVSMECLFKGFDFVLMSASGSTQVVTRSEATAYLSKYLRAYGGTGQFSGYRVGRLLRNVVFSRTGLVRNPANPESVILTPEGVKAEVASWLAARTVGDEDRLGLSRQESWAPPAFAVAAVQEKKLSPLEMDIASFLYPHRIEE